MKDVARLIEQDRREVRSEERKACAERFCNYCNPEGYDPALPCCTACDGRAVILAGKVHIAREGI